MNQMLPTEFYLRPTARVARDLLGKIIVHHPNGRILSGRIVEVEAYHQSEAAAHSFPGLTKRNRVMFEAGGALYVYLIYGIHHCLNVVTEQAGVGAAVLIRAIEPLEGQALMQKNRGGIKGPRAWTNGPGKLCQALGIDRRHDGLSLRGPVISLHDAPRLKPAQVGTSERIGITKATDLQWRFFEKGNPFVSR